MDGPITHTKFQELHNTFWVWDTSSQLKMGYLSKEAQSAYHQNYMTEPYQIYVTAIKALKNAPYSQINSRLAREMMQI